MFGHAENETKRYAKQIKFTINLGYSKAIKVIGQDTSL